MEKVLIKLRAILTSMSQINFKYNWNSSSFTHTYVSNFSRYFWFELRLFLLDVISCIKKNKYLLYLKETEKALFPNTNSCMNKKTELHLVEAAVHAEVCCHDIFSYRYCSSFILGGEKETFKFFFFKLQNSVELLEANSPTQFVTH